METGSIQEIILLILAVCKCTLFFALEFVRRSGEKGKNQDFFIFQFAKCMTDAILRYPNDVGEMAERLKAQHWKCCLGEILTRVRISLSPPLQTHFYASGNPQSHTQKHSPVAISLPIFAPVIRNDGKAFIAART